MAISHQLDLILGEDIQRITMVQGCSRAVWHGLEAAADFRFQRVEARMTS